MVGGELRRHVRSRRQCRRHGFDIPDSADIGERDQQRHGTAEAAQLTHQVGGLAIAGAESGDGGQQRIAPHFRRLRQACEQSRGVEPHHLRQERRMGQDPRHQRSRARMRGKMRLQGVGGDLVMQALDQFALQQRRGAGFRRQDRRRLQPVTELPRHCCPLPQIEGTPTGFGFAVEASVSGEGGVSTGLGSTAGSEMTARSPGALSSSRS